MSKVEKKSILDHIISTTDVPSFTLTSSKIIVDWKLKGKEETKSTTIKRKDYEQWLQSSGALNCSFDHVDASGDIVKVAAMQSPEEYWEEGDWITHTEHLKEYLVKYYDPYTETLQAA